MWLHQHFNAGPTPARYLAFKHWSPRNGQGVPISWISRRLGGTQIDYADEHPRCARCSPRRWRATASPRAWTTSTPPRSRRCRRARRDAPQRQNSPLPARGERSSEARVRGPLSDSERRNSAPGGKAPHPGPLPARGRGRLAPPALHPCRAVPHVRRNTPSQLRKHSFSISGAPKPRWRIACTRLGRRRRRQARPGSGRRRNRSRGRRRPRRRVRACARCAG